MTRVSILQATADYLSAGQIPFLNTVNPWPARVTPQGEFDLGLNAGSGAIIHMLIEDQQEERIAGGGAGIAPLAPIAGRKWVQYSVTLICHLRSTKPQAENAGADMDCFLDGLLARIRADRTLGTAGTATPIFQAGEGGRNGGPDLHITPSFPRLLNGQLVQVFAAVKVTVCEVIFS